MAGFCLVHGKWHDSSCWEPLAAALGERGHETVAPELPLDVPGTGYDEAARPAVAALAELPAPAVLVGHSLAAAYSPLAAVARPDCLLVHLCPAPVGPFAGAGAPARPIRRGFRFPPERPDGTSAWEPAAAIAAIYPRLPRDVAEAAAARLKPGVSPPPGFPLERHPAVVTAVVYATEDEFFEPEWTRQVARTVCGVEAIAVTTGHFPMLEAPEALADLLDRLAGERPASGGFAAR